MTRKDAGATGEEAEIQRQELKRQLEELCVDGVRSPGYQAVTHVRAILGAKGHKMVVDGAIGILSPVQRNELNVGQEGLEAQQRYEQLLTSAEAAKASVEGYAAAYESAQNIASQLESLVPSGSGFACPEYYAASCFSDCISSVSSAGLIPGLEIVRFEHEESWSRNPANRHDRAVVANPSS